MLRRLEFETNGEYIVISEDTEEPDQFTLTIGDGDTEEDKLIGFNRGEIITILGRLQDFIDNTLPA